MPQRTPARVYENLRQIAPDFADKIGQAAQVAHNEAEFEAAINTALAGVAQEMGVQLLFRQQYTLATGLADAVYNRFIIEYEPPRSLRPALSHVATQHAVQQVKDYIEAAARAELRVVEEEVDQAAADMWGLSAQELEDVRASLRELKGAAVSEKSL